MTELDFSAGVTRWSGVWHPLAQRFPMPDEDELRALAASIATNGQLVPCVMTRDGLGLDGRSRVAAHGLNGTEPVWQEYDGDPVGFIVGVNAERRHLSTGQRAMATAIGLVDAGLRENGRFKRGTVPGDNGGSSVTAWSKSVQQAGVVLDHAPDLADRVLSGELALDAAHKQADDERKRRAKLGELGSELAALVDAGVIDLDEAERRADEAVRLEQLPDDLAERVREGSLQVAEAETINTERRERIVAYVAKVRDALDVLVRMADYPLPDGFAQALPATEVAVLTAVLTTISKEMQ